MPQPPRDYFVRPASICRAGFFAFQKLNIESYPNPTPVILEITAQAAGLSAEEMERYYTIPIEIGLYTTPGIEVIRSTSFYGLSFIRVVFKYGVDYNFAYAQADIAIQQNVTLPANQIPQIQQNSIALIIGLLYCLFNSLRDCLLALAGIPFVVVGGVLALYLTGQDFSISAAIGFISLFGVSVMDGILMISYYNNERRLRSLAPADAMFRAASTRMRPLLMTALSACIGLFPAAISTGIGSQVQRPLATVIVGGMLVGPIMLLLAVPALRMVFLGREEKPQPKAQSA